MPTKRDIYSIKTNVVISLVLFLRTEHLLSKILSEEMQQWTLLSFIPISMCVHFFTSNHRTFAPQFIWQWTLTWFHWVIIWIRVWIDLKQQIDLIWFVIRRNSYRTDLTCVKRFICSDTHRKRSLFIYLMCSHIWRGCVVLLRDMMLSSLMKTDGCELANKHSNIISVTTNNGIRWLNARFGMTNVSRLECNTESE